MDGVGHLLSNNKDTFVAIEGFVIKRDIYEINTDINTYVGKITLN